MILLLALLGDANAGCVLIDNSLQGDIKLVDDRIEAIAEQIRPAGCEVLDASGKHVTAGFIEVGSQLGLVEVGLEDATRDADAGGDDPIRAALRVADAYNPRSSLIPIQRMGGVTGALVVPTGGRISGQSAHVSLAGASQAETVLDSSVAVHANIGGNSRAQGLRELRTVLRDARAFRSVKSAWERGQSRQLAADGADLEALWPVLDRTIPLVVPANRAADIEALIRLAAEERVRLVVDGGAEAHLLAKQLADAQIAVIVDPYVYGPGGFDSMHGSAANPALLAEAGVDVIIATRSSHNARLLGQAAGNAVRGGMKPEDALAAITSTPASVFGLEGRGALEAGAMADVVLWSGDPLEVTSWPEAVWIGGRAIEMESRQTRLRDAYVDLPGSPRPALELD